jgi:hypothetical protein
MHRPTLTSSTKPQMDGFAQTLFYIGFTMGLVVAWMVWKRFLWADKFFMPMWAFGFPTAALAWSGILYDRTISTALRCVCSFACVEFCPVERGWGMG